MADGIPFGLRPWPTGSSNRAPKSVAEFIARTNAEVDGGFRAISEKNLKQRIEQQQQSEDLLNQTNDDDDDAMDLSEEEAEDEKKDPNVVKMDILRNMDHAHNCAMVTLDFMSLLLTKELPVQAGTSLTARLREMVGIGTLGSNKILESNVTAVRVQNDSMIGLGWALMDVDQARQAAAKLSASMKEETSKENKYWESVVSVSESGWAVCRLPNERQTLGVKFGFTEANPKFRNASLAPMRRSEEGSARLDLGKLGGVSKRLCVSIDVDGTIVGRSKLSSPILDDAPLATHVLEARNTVFAQELWHELQMEARSLLSYGVSRDNSRIVYQTPTPGRKVTLELVDINNLGFKPEPLAQDDAANAISITLSLLLTHVHRQSEHMHSQALPPHVSRKRTIDHHDLLRPIIARELYRKSITECTQYVGSVVKTLRNAGFPEARFTVVASPHKVKDMIPHVAKLQRISQAQAYMSALLQPLSFRIQLVVTKDSRLTIIGRTFLAPLTMTMYTVYVSGPGPQLPNYLTNILAQSSQYPSMRELRQLLCLVMAVAVSQRCQDTLDREEKEKFIKREDSQPLAQALAQPSAPAVQWVRGLDNTTLRRSIAPVHELSFIARDIAVGESPLGAVFQPELSVFFKTKASGTDLSPPVGSGSGNGGSSSSAVTELMIESLLPSAEECVSSREGERVLRWTPDEAVAGSVLEACQRVVRGEGQA